MSETLDPVTRHHVHNAAEALKEEFSGVFSVETIERYIAESVDALGNSRITVFVPVLAPSLRPRAADGARPGAGSRAHRSA